MEWIIICGIAVAMYIILYKYEKRMAKMQEIIDENREQIEKNNLKIKDNHQKITKNDGRLYEHYNHFEKLWVSHPKHPHYPEEKN